MRFLFLLILLASCSSTIIKNGEEIKEVFIKDIISNSHQIEYISSIEKLEDPYIKCINSDIKSPSFSMISEAGYITLPEYSGLFHCHFSGKDKKLKVESEFNVLITQGHTATIIVDIDNTITDANPLEFLLNDHTTLKQLPNASKSLKKMIKKYQIIYLTARNEIFREHTKKWLSHNSFPPGPVLYWNLTDYPFFDSSYKTIRISKIKEKVSNIVFAVGDRDSDIEAYLANNLKTIIIRDSDSKVTNVDFVTGWDEIMEKHY